MRSFVVLLIIGSLVLSSCTKKNESTGVTVSDKTPFVVDIFPIKGDTIQTTVEKTGRVTARSSLTLNSKGVGEVAKIEVKEGSQIKAGTVIARLKDTLTNYDLQLAQAENALKMQIASRETSKINLDSAVNNARIAYERAQQAYDTLMDRNALQYDITVSGNKKTLDAYNENFRTYLTELEKSMTQYLHEGDKILGLTNVFEFSNDGWESYLGARIGNIKVDADNKWNTLYTLRGQLRARIEKGVEIDRQQPEKDIEILAQGYQELRLYVDTMLYMLQNNVVGAGLSQVQQDGWMLAWNGYRAAVGGSESGFNAWKGQTVSFFKNYKKTEQATKLAIATLDRTLTPEEVALLDTDIDLKTTYETSKLDLRERLNNTELSLEQAKLGFENAEAIRAATLAQLDGSKKAAELSLELSRRNADNLLVRAPVSGSVAKVLTSVGQSVNNGSPIIEFTSNEPEILLDVESNLARTLTVGSEVSIAVDEKHYKGTIIALSSVSGKNLLTSLRIAVIDGKDIIGKTGKIVFSPNADLLNETGILSIPLEAVRIIAENEGEIRYLQNEKILTKTVKIDAIRAGFVETSTNLNDISEIIITDTSNYNPEKNILKVE